MQQACLAPEDRSRAWQGSWNRASGASALRMFPGPATAPAILETPRARASLTASGVASSALGSSVAYAGACVLALAAPFELTQPILRLPSQSISNLEALLLLVFAAWFAALVSSRRLPRWDTSLTWPWMALLGAMMVAAVAAPGARMNAFHMTGRFMVAFGVYLLAVNGLTTSARLERALAAALLAGAVVSVLAVLEYLQVGPILRWLKVFRPDQTAVGSQVRAGGPLQYPTIASMYLEVVFAFGLGLLSACLDASRRAWVVAVFVALVLSAEAIVLTFTRSGLLVLATSVAVVGFRRYALRGADQGVKMIAALAVLVVGSLFTSRSAQSVWLRLTSEGQEGWYRVVIDPPPHVELPTNQMTTVPVNVTNTGRLTWDSLADPPFYLAYHWLEAESDRVVSFDGTRTAFTAPVAPGTTASVDAQVRAPDRPGRYRLAWDLVLEGHLWFSTEPGGTLTAFSSAIVSGPTGGGRVVTSRLPRRAVRPGRLVLWRAAARMLGAHPLLGVGPDNYRLLYGEYAGLSGADRRVHTNDMYLEVIAGTGLVGGLAFAWLIWRAAGCVASNLRLAADRSSTVGLGIAAAGIGIGLHGVFDSFLSFTPTYVLIALTLGMAVANVPPMETQPDANRV